MANFAVSMELPPPTPTMASAPTSRARRAVSAAPESWGFCSTSPKTAAMQGISCIIARASGAKWRPQTSTHFLHPSSSRIAPSC